VTDASGAPAETNPSIEALKRLKSAEAEAETKLKRLREEGSEKLRQLSIAAEETVRTAKASAERDADSAVEKARATLKGDLAAVLQVGEADAAKVGARSKAAMASLEPKLLDAVLGEFRSD
jgi:vacuolar-type H+-ATPase subunit H